MLNRSIKSDPAEEEQFIATTATRSKSVEKFRANYNKCATFLIFIFPACGGLLFGYDIGATSAVVAQLQSNIYSGTNWYSAVENSSVLTGIITSMGMFGAMLGSMTCFQVADDIGRRRSLMFASTMFMLGSILEYFSGNVAYDERSGIVMLLFGRVIYGFGCGFAMHGAPAYIGEMAPSSIRGLLVSLKEGFVVLGMVLGYTIGYFNAEVVGGWRLTYLSSFPFAFVMGCGMSYLPYSARWLALKGRVEEARQSLLFVTPELPESEIESIHEVARKAAESQQNQSMSATWTRLTSPTVWPALVAGVGLVFLQQVSGQPSVLYYADSIFEDIGLDKVASIAVSVFKFVATLFATFTVDNYGRKKLLYTGCTLMLVALICMGTTFLFPYTSTGMCNDYSTELSCSSACSWDAACGADCSSAGFDPNSCTCCGASSVLSTQKIVILVSLFLYIGGYQVGFGPISWLLISEIFPLEVRGKAVSIAVVTNFFWNTVMAFVFPVELQYFGTAATFYIYAVVLVFGIYFIYSRVPETKGLSLEEIEEYFLRTSRQKAEGNYKLVHANETDSRLLSHDHHDAERGDKHGVF